MVRDDGVTIPGETAIPYGTYQIDITPSPRFKRELPLLVKVNGFVIFRRDAPHGDDIFVDGACVPF